MIGEKIKDLREKKGLTITALGKELGCSPQYISQIEKNKQDVNREMIIKFSKYFNITSDYLLFEDTETYIEQIEAIEPDNNEPSVEIDKEYIQKIIDSHLTLNQTHDKVINIMQTTVNQILKINDNLMKN